MFPIKGDCIGYMQPLSDIFFCLVPYNYCGTKISKINITLLKNLISINYKTINFFYNIKYIKIIIQTDLIDEESFRSK